MRLAYLHAPIFTGTEWLYYQAILVQDGITEAIVSLDEIPADVQFIDAGGKILVPAFLDLQIYGASSKLFSAYPQPESLQALYEHNQLNGTADCLVTIATQPLPIIYQCIDAIKTYWQQGGQGILGMHLEGPFLNPEKRGAHVAKWIHAPSANEVRELLHYAGDVIKMMTIAPEVCSEEVLQIIREAGIVISAGHSNADFGTAKAGFDKGITAVTHLFNAMSSMHHRQPGLPVAAMLHASSASIIPDGIHVSYEMVKLAKQAMSERLFFITDAVTNCNTGPYQHVLNNDHYTLPDGTLSGSALTLKQAVINAVQHCKIPLEESMRMASVYPAKVMGLESKYGKIAPGYPAPALLPANLLSEQQVMGNDD